jgi:hypothetical protein
LGTRPRRRRAPSACPPSKQRLEAPLGLFTQGAGGGGSKRGEARVMGLPRRECVMEARQARNRTERFIERGVRKAPKYEP